MIEIKISDLEVSKFNVRDCLPDKGKLEEIKQTIKENGIIEPLIVRQKDNKYEIIVGQLRYLCSKELGLKELPCIIKELTDSECLEISLIENLQRENLEPIDTAEALKRMYDIYCSTSSGTNQNIKILVVVVHSK